MKLEGLSKSQVLVAGVFSHFKNLKISGSSISSFSISLIVGGQIIPVLVNNLFLRFLAAVFSNCTIGIATGRLLPR